MGGTFPLVLLLGALVGCGVATFSVGIARVSYWFPHRRQGTALATYAGLGNSSPGLSAILLPLGVAGIGITSAYGVWLAVLAAVAMAYALLAKDAPWFQLARGELDVEEHHRHAPSSAAEGGPRPSGSARKALSIAAHRATTWENLLRLTLSLPATTGVLRVLQLLNHRLLIGDVVLDSALICFHSYHLPGTKVLGIPEQSGWDTAIIKRSG